MHKNHSIYVQTGKPGVEQKKKQKKKPISKVKTLKKVKTILQLKTAWRKKKYINAIINSGIYLEIAKG